MALKIYGVARSRAFRTLWMAKELGLDYEHVKVDFATGETRTPEHLALNPNGHVPVIDDDGFILWESMAINLYLAKKYGAGGFYPSRLQDEARAWQWSFWGMTELERPVLTVLFNRAILPESQRDAAAADAAEKTLAQPFAVLQGVLSGSAYLLGDQIHGGRSQRRSHSRLGAAGADRLLRRAESRRVAQGLRRAAGGPRRPPAPARVSAPTRRQALALGVGAIGLPDPFRSRLP
jgi:glutathione S-transferase